MKTRNHHKPVFPYKHHCLYLAMAIVLLGGCGGSTSDDTKFLGGASDSNVALQSAGATASANYNDIQASKAIDGDTSTSEYWSGNVTDDFMTVNLGKIRNIKQINIFTSDTSFNTNQPNKLIEISSDGNTWNSTAQVSGGNITCDSISISSSSISCGYSNRQQLRYIRFTTKASGAAAALLNVYEIQAIGY